MSSGFGFEVEGSDFVECPNIGDTATHNNDLRIGDGRAVCVYCCSTGAVMNPTKYPQCYTDPTNLWSSRKRYQEHPN